MASFSKNSDAEEWFHVDGRKPPVQLVRLIHDHDDSFFSPEDPTIDDMGYQCLHKDGPVQPPMHSTDFNKNIWFQAWGRLGYTQQEIEQAVVEVKLRTTFWCHECQQDFPYVTNCPICEMTDNWFA